MAPIRRYLRITKYSVLEVRIYLTDPYQHTWLLNPRDDVLPRIITAVRPHVFRQLWDDKDRARGKSKKKKGIKDVAYGDDFEVSIFLTDPSTRHSLLVKQKDFEKKKKKIQSNSGKLTGWLKGSHDTPINVDEGDEYQPVQIREESDDEASMTLDDFHPVSLSTASKSKEKNVQEEEVSEDEGFQSPLEHAKGWDKAVEDDKKKLDMNLSYDGFSIYGRVLCLVVKRKGQRAPTINEAGPAALPAAAGGGASDNPDSGRHMLENWVSTQAAQEATILEED